MSLPVRNLKCLSPVMCQCKVICSNRTLSLMFGCKVSPWGGAHLRAADGRERLFECMRDYLNNYKERGLIVLVVALFITALLSLQ